MSKVFTRAQAFAVLLLVVQLVCPVRIAAAQTDKEMRAAKRIKKTVIEIGVGQKARVTVRLRDGTEVKGYIKEIAEDKFSIVEETSGATRDLTYLQVQRVERKGLPKAAKAAIVVVAVGFAAVLLGVILLKAVQDK